MAAPARGVPTCPVRTRGQQQLPHLCFLARPRRADVPCPPPSHTRTVPAVPAASPGAVLHWGLVLSPGKPGAIALCREQPRMELNQGPDSSTPVLSTEHTALGTGFQKMKEALGRVSKHRAWCKEREELCCAAAWASSRLSACARLCTHLGFASHVPHRGVNLGPLGPSTTATAVQGRASPREPPGNGQAGHRARQCQGWRRGGGGCVLSQAGCKAVGERIALIFQLPRCNM